MARLRRTDLFILLLLIALFIYVVLRSVILDITNDEAYSFYIVKNFWYAEALCTGNTHWINSLAIKCSVLLGFENPWQIRWLSIVSTLVFFTLAFWWIRSVKEISLKLLVFVMLLLNPYILDYFGLARGYAPGLMFQALSLFLFILFLKNSNRRLAFLALLCSGLSALSNFSFVYFFMAFSLVYFFVIYFKSKEKFLASFPFYRDSIYTLIISSLVIRAFIFMTRCSNDVVGAGTTDFLEYTMVFLQGLLYDRVIDHVTLKFLSPIVFGLSVLSCLLGIFRKGASENKIYFFSSQVLLIMISTIIILNIAFAVVFPYYRSAIFLFPTMGICFICMLELVLKMRLVGKLAIFALSVLLAVNFIWTCNLKSTLDYRIQANLEESFDYLKSLKAKKVGISDGLYGSYRNYYQITKASHRNFKGDLIETKNPDSLSPDENALSKYDYLLIAPPYNLGYYRNNKVRFDAVKIFKESGSLIVRVVH